MSYECKYCNKSYTSIQSRSNHYRLYHNNDITQKSSASNPIVTQKSSGSNPLVTQHITESNITCKYCNKNYKYKQGKWRHEQKCKEKNNLIKENDLLKNELDKMQNQIITLLNEKAKIHPKTLQKINNQLNNSNNNSSINNSQINNGSIHNGPVINNTYVKFGKVGFSKVLTKKQILSILSHPYISLEESIRMIHFNEDLPEYNNIYITNVRDNIAYIFDGNKFISVKKNDIVSEMIDNYADEIEISLDEYKETIPEYKINRLQKFLDLLNNDDKYIDKHHTTHPNYKAYKMSDIKMLIYNHSDSKKLNELTKMKLNEKLITYDSDNEE